MNATRTAIVRALALCGVLDVEHTNEEVHRAFRAVRHELETLRRVHCIPPAATGAKLTSGRRGEATEPGSMRHAILGLLRDLGPMADFQLREALNKRQDIPEWPALQHLRRRRHELSAAGWLEPVMMGDDYHKVRHERTLRYCTVYQLTEAGERALKRLASGQEVLFTDGELGNS